MRLSYIIPVYNVEKYLTQCLDSILAQTLTDYEVILVDDSSPDRCPEICDSYAEKYPTIVKVIHQENKGAAAARNAALSVAKGDYIFFIDSDDYLVEDCVEVLLSKAIEFDADVLQTSYYTCKENDSTQIKNKSLFPENTLLTHTDMEREICFAPTRTAITYLWQNLYKRAFLVENSIKFEDQLVMNHDGPFNMQAFTKAKRVVAVDIPLYCYRLRSGSLQRRKFVPNFDKWLYLQWELKLKYYNENCTPSALFYENLAEHTIKAIFTRILNHYYKNKPEEAFVVLKRLGNSEMMRRSFADYDINKFRSKSLDWLMTWFTQKKLYFFAHLICKYILYK
ncbi:MAG: glycosyltransferase [Clostridia bacterium]|nr:glycosyltransferase [Clostridia bacterium]